MIDGLLLLFLVVLSNLSWFGIWVFVGFEKKIFFFLVIWFEFKWCCEYILGYFGIWVCFVFMLFMEDRLCLLESN